MAAHAQRGSKVLGAFLALIVILTALWPAAGVVSLFLNDAGKPAASPGPGIEPALSMAPDLPLLFSTLAWALGIGVGATILAWPAAWVIRRRGWGVVALLATPLLLPSYLAYSAYNILRAPGSTIGEWIEALVKQGFQSAPIAAGRMVAGLGLCLWVWPIAAIVLGASLRRLDESVLDALRLERISAPRRAWELLKLSRAGVLGAVFAVGIVMLGSAVPLQLAQVPTYAIKIWLDLTLAPGSWRVWAAAWPLILIALAAGWLIGSRLLRRAAHEELNTGPAPRARGHTATNLAAATVWASSVLVPLALFASTLFYSREQGHLIWRPEQWKAVPRFWKVAHESLQGSLLVATLVGAIAALITAAIWQGLSGQALGTRLWALGRFTNAQCPVPSAFTRLAIRMLLVTGLFPGVLIGAAVAAAANMHALTSPLTDSPLILVLGHTARFGCVAALIGVWLAAIEPPHERELRLLDGAGTLKGWLHACLPVQAGALIGSALAAAALSLHEIEAAVVLQPPGVPSLAQLMLNNLHQLQMQDLSAAAVVLVGGGVVIAVLAGLGVWWTAKVRA